MPQPLLPPTPASSKSIKALERHPTLETTFNLPPPAMSSGNPMSPPDEPATESTPPSVTSSASSYHPSPPTSPARKSYVTSRKRTLSGSRKGKSGPTVSITTVGSEVESPSLPFTLPPPPQRARKIIQMTPKSEVPSTVAGQTATGPASSSKGKGSTKRKQNTSATTAAGRRIARKTAHSIIERRRRSKMNEEFGVLKNMIPACRGQEMHKLAILQAGIEYVRWLEGVIVELKKGQQIPSTTPRSESGARDELDHVGDEVPPPPSATSEKLDVFSERRDSIAISDASPDLGPTISSTSSRSKAYQQHRTNNLESPSISTPSTAFTTPSIVPTQTLLSPAFGNLHFSPEFITRRSPNIGGGGSGGGGGMPPHQASTTPSPRILPMPAAMMELDSPERQRDAHTPDQEATATAALMMLTRHDRRNSLSRYKIGHAAGEGVPMNSSFPHQMGDDRSRPSSSSTGGPRLPGTVDNEGRSGGGGSNVNFKAMSVRDLLST